SRGAARAVMVERDRAVAQALRESARQLGADAAHIVHGDGLAWLRTNTEKFDVVFLDPPFASGLAQRALDLLPAHMAAGGRVYVESAEPVAADAWRAVREDRAGAVRYALFELATP
ncbi:MAG TPA: RsmD family RNA methyltransferase, partial [Usitatibacter sp.]|nr:RsmD family RNA methyltransferase [Usitatibacter sp.]